MESLRLDMEVDAQFHHCSTGQKDMQPYVLVYMDNYFDAQPIRVVVEVNSKQDMTISKNPAPIHMHCRASICFKDITIPESIFTDRVKYHLDAENAKHMANNTQQSNNEESNNNSVDPTKIIPTDSHVLVHLYAVHRNEQNIGLYTTVGSARIGLLALRGAYDRTRKSGDDFVEIPIMSLRSHEKHAQSQIGSIRFRHPETSDAFVLSPGSKWKDITAYKRQFTDTKWEDPLVMEHAKRVYRWVKSRFQLKYAKTENICSYFNFSNFSRTIPITCLMQRDPVINEMYVLNLYYAAFRRFLYIKQRSSLLLERTPEDDPSPPAKMTTKIPRKRGDLDVEFRKLTLKEKSWVLAQMLTAVPASFVYLQDHMHHADGTYEVIDLFEYPWETGAGDCEDFALAIAYFYVAITMGKSRQQPDVCPYSHENLVLLWHLAKCYSAPLCLDRVTTKNLSDAQMAPDNNGDSTNEEQDTVTAHMNVMMMRTRKFLESIRLDRSIHNTEDSKRLARAIKSELKLVDKHISILQEQFNVAPSDINSLPDLVLEGTGMFSPHGEESQDAAIYKYIEEGEGVFSCMPRMIYYPKGSRKKFFLNEMVMFTPLFLQKYGIGATGFFFTTLPKNIPDDPVSLFMGKPTVYGITYDDYLSGMKDMRLVAEPFLTDNEIDYSYFTSRLKPPAPKFIAMDDVSKFNSPDAPLANAWREMVRLKTPEAFSVPVRTYQFEPSSKMFDEVEFSGNRGDWIFKSLVKFSAGEDNQAKVSSAIICDNIRETDYQMVITMLDEIKKAVYKELKLPQHKKNDDGITFAYYFVKRDMFRFAQFRSDLMRVIKSRKRITFLDFDVETLAPNVCNIIICLGVKDGTSGNY